MGAIAGLRARHRESDLHFRRAVRLRREEGMGGGGGKQGNSRPIRRLLGNPGKRGRWPEPRLWEKNGDKSTAPRTVREIG